MNPSHSPAYIIEKLKTKQSMKNTTICLSMIVRNESKNMVRLFESLKCIINYISVVDTGSLDNTIKVMKKWANDNKIPIVVDESPFKNFGYNRTEAINKAKIAFPEATYFILSDADFVWEFDLSESKQLKFKKELMMSDKYMVEQYNDVISYDNTRVLKADKKWKCRGVTHEFWASVEGNITSNKINTFRIHDIGDGGHKQEKYTRDIKLIEDELAFLTGPKPNMASLDYDHWIEDQDLISRYYFYLGESYKHNGQYDKAIISYQKRIDHEIGWHEDRFFSMFQMGNCYQYLMDLVKVEFQTTDATSTEGPSGPSAFVDSEEMKKFYEEKMIECYKKAHEILPQRAESLAALAKYYRLHNRHQECYDICEIGRKIKYPTNLSLFIERSCYQYRFDYELCIVCYYIDKKDEGAEAIIRLFEMEPLIPESTMKSIKRNSQFYL